MPNMFTLNYNRALTYACTFALTTQQNCRVSVSSLHDMGCNEMELTCQTQLVSTGGLRKQMREHDGGEEVETANTTTP